MRNDLHQRETVQWTFASLYRSGAWVRAQAEASCRRLAQRLQGLYQVHLEQTPVDSPLGQRWSIGRTSHGQRRCIRHGRLVL